MKLVFVTRGMGFGGAERVIAQLASYMIEEEVEYQRLFSLTFSGFIF